jgi:predicted phage terminase large subunit-like protein
MSSDKELYAILRDDLYSFMQRSFHTLNPGVEYLENEHMEAMCHALMQVYEGETNRLIITLPPRMGKSLCVSIAFVAWVLGHLPQERILVGSYAQALAASLSNDTRRVMKEEFYRNTFPHTCIDPNKDTEMLFQTTKNGGRMAVTVGGSVTGMGGNYLIIDDAMKATEFPSEHELDDTGSWFNGTFFSRLNDKINGKIIVVMQRIHEDDLVGRLLEAGGWTHLNLPAIAPEKASIELGNGRVWHRNPGDVLHPAREPLEVLERTRQTVGSYIFSAQYLQNPVPQGGGIVPWEWFKTYEEEPDTVPGELIVQSWDTATTTHDTSSFSVCTTWVYQNGNSYLLDVYRNKLNYPDLRRHVEQHAHEWRADLLIIEQHSGSLPLIQSLVEETNLHFTGLKPEKSKADRMLTVTPAIEAGRVKIPAEAEWLAEFRHELMAFPKGKHDDQVDSLSQYLIWERERLYEYPHGGGMPGRGRGPNGEPAGGDRVTIIEVEPDLDLRDLY